ncbi:endonuclease-reverse transcriptase [Plakobranchus ocellatus]|uniref:Endonuclease-reverse transcriptase n=1 Tax=Plakobranchus ocellatus TaxID=259542 RepID=A0AAV4BTU1_9GAST|nr:endonuclease-reverse transcriptase [Plakobranchus ocellatus]
MQTGVPLIGWNLELDAILNSVFVDEQSSKVWRPRKYFKHFRDELILSELLLACRQLGKFGNIHILVDHLLDVCQTSATYRLAATLIINEMVLGAACLDKVSSTAEVSVESQNAELLPGVISMLMDEYLSSENLRLLDNIAEKPESTASASAPSLSSALVIVREDKTAVTKQKALSRNQAILQMCLHMEGLAKFAKVLGPGRQEHLIRSLYPLVENLGHENLFISSTAFAALIEVAVAGGYRTLDCLLRENADYLVSSVSLRLRHFHRNRRTPQTLCVMLKYCSKELLPHVRRSVTQLLDSLDDNYTEYLVLFMPVLLELVRAIARWFPPPVSFRCPGDSPAHGKKDEFQRAGEESNDVLDSQKVLSFLVEHVKMKRLAEGDFLEEQSKDPMTLEDIEREVKARATQKEMEEEIPEEPAGEEEKEVLPHIVVVKEVFQRVRNLLSTKNGQLRVQVLDVVSQGVQCLKGAERELLPQVHQVWAGFRPLFHSQEKFIVIKAVKTLLTLSEAAGDFLRQRTMKEVIPGLASFMEKQAKISNDCHSGYLYTGNYKLQLCVLLTMGPLAKNVRPLLFHLFLLF